MQCFGEVVGRTFFVRANVRDHTGVVDQRGAGERTGLQMADPALQPICRAGGVGACDKRQSSEMLTFLAISP